MNFSGGSPQRHSSEHSGLYAVLYRKGHAKEAHLVSGFQALMADGNGLLAECDLHVRGHTD